MGIGPQISLLGLGKSEPEDEGKLEDVVEG